MDIKTAAIIAKSASIKLAGVSGEVKNKALETVIRKLDDNRIRIAAANLADIEQSQKENLGCTFA